jgi:hypothetical protein
VAVGGRGSRNVGSWGRRNVSDRPTHWYGSVTAAARTMMVVCPCLHDKPCQQVCAVACHWQPCARGPGQWRRVCVCVCVFGPPGARTHARTMGIASSRLTCLACQVTSCHHWLSDLPALTVPVPRARGHKAREAPTHATHTHLP